MKRSEALQPLSRDHHQALVFSKRLLQIYSRDQVAAEAYWREWRQIAGKDMLRHFSEEEQRFLKLLRQENANDLEQRLLSEHTQLRALMAQDQVDAAIVFADLLKQHVRFEERELFGWIESHSPEALPETAAEV
ncbi:hypothetical protein [Marinobacterium jannaschii]|uniref:hypothetical protein n=1 Tax=Marinobacterium jannaschii TaxID=64970 RepID=UPI0005677EF0|nr:hypothetical protein [Marinobacterium jannaschii]